VKPADSREDEISGEGRRRENHVRRMSGEEREREMDVM
jgi:hypothetical protein